MSVRSAKDAIREARLRAGLTQEKLSEGICSPKVLSRIESGKSGVSPATFQALMEHAGASCERYPVFASREDFDCFYALKHARFYLNAWQLEPACTELQNLESKNWADNKLYYQEWLLLHCRLQRRSCCYDHQLCYDTLLYALHITKPKINLSDFHSLLLSKNELQLLTALGHEALYLEEQELCMLICGQVEQYLAFSSFTSIEKDRMQAEAAIVHAKYLISQKDYSGAFQTANAYQHKMTANVDTTPLFELTFLSGLCLYYSGDIEKAASLMKTAFYSAYAVSSPYATLCRNYLAKETDFIFPAFMRSLPDILLKEYPAPEMTEASMSHTDSLQNGIYDLNSPHVYTFGNLLRDLRTEQKVSQKTLCQGLCGKSMLSKIENGFLQPDIALAETLLQRLGVSEGIFIFWGDEKETTIHDLKFKLVHDQVLPKEMREKYLKEMKELIDENHSVYRQEYLMLKALKADSAEERITGLIEALYVTLPDFSIDQIRRCRLSWTELTILNNIAHEYRRTDDAHLSSLYFQKILEYASIAKPDILLQAHFLPITNYMYCHSLYIQKQYKDVLALHSKINLQIMKFSVSAYGGYLFCYSQACGECEQFEQMVSAAVQSCAINTFIGLHKNASALKKYIRQDFSTDLKY